MMRDAFDKPQELSQAQLDRIVEEGRDAHFRKYLVGPEKSSRSRYLLDAMHRSGGYTLQETQGVWVETLQSLP
jgi:hypothetical protein